MTGQTQAWAAVTWCASGIALVASAMLAWTTSGAGSSLAGHQVADVLRSGALGDGSVRTAGLLWYALPLAGAALIGLSGLTGDPVRTGRAAVLVLAGLTALATLAALGVRSPGRLDSGGWLALAGIALGVAALRLDPRPGGPR